MRGLTWVALIVGASYSFRNQELAVVGGGDTAVEEAIYLTKYGSMVRPYLCSLLQQILGCRAQCVLA